MRNLTIILGLTGLLLMVSVSSASALSMLYFDPVDDQMFNIGDTIIYDLYADIDADDAIMGFGFDISFDGGVTFISAPNDSGSYLTFDSFTGNSDYFYYEPFFDDGDTISGWRTLFDPDVYGTGIRLGTFQFTAHTLGVETIILDADNLGPTGTEGLVQGKFGGVGFMPNTPSATASPIPDPATVVLLFSAGLIGIAGFRRKFRKDRGGKWRRRWLC